MAAGGHQFDADPCGCAPCRFFIPVSRRPRRHAAGRRLDGKQSGVDRAAPGACRADPGRWPAGHGRARPGRHCPRRRWTGRPRRGRRPDARLCRHARPAPRDGGAGRGGRVSRPAPGLPGRAACGHCLACPCRVRCHGRLGCGFFLQRLPGRRGGGQRPRAGRGRAGRVPGGHRRRHCRWGHIAFARSADPASRCPRSLRPTVAWRQLQAARRPEPSRSARPWARLPRSLPWPICPCADYR